jgi:integrase
MGKFSSVRNFGFGKQMGYAGLQSLKSYYGGGHHSSVHSHAARWGESCRWLREHEGIRDATQITQEIVEKYAKYVADKVEANEISVAYAQNLLSSVNVTLQALRGDSSIKVSPAKSVGQRCTVRMTAPTGFDRNQLQKAIDEMRALGLDRAATAAEVAREFGVRIREATLADLDSWQKLAMRNKFIDVQDGCKGGRDAERLVRVTPFGMEVLERALASRPEGSKNLLSSNETYAQFKDGEIKRAREILHAHGIKGFHDLRAAYACELYASETGHAAPALGGKILDKKLDRHARMVVAMALGHNRIDVTAEYVGSAKK